MKQHFYKYRLRNGEFLKDGHTMFLPDVLSDLQRKSYLECLTIELQQRIDDLTSAHTERVNRIIELEEETNKLNDTIDAQRSLLKRIKSDLLMRGEKDKGCVVVDLSNSIWRQLNDTLNKEYK